MTGNLSASTTQMCKDLTSPDTTFISISDLILQSKRRQRQRSRKRSRTKSERELRKRGEKKKRRLGSSKRLKRMSSDFSRYLKERDPDRSLTWTCSLQ